MKLKVILVCIVITLICTHVLTATVFTHIRSHHEHTSTAKAPHLEVLNAEARIYLYHNFLSEEECDAIIEKAGPRLKRSDVRNEETGEVEVSTKRTSWGMYFTRAEDPTIEAVERRIAEWTLFPTFQQEGMEVVRYLPSDKSDEHYDAFFNEDNNINGGNRLATVLIYLSDVEEGGETTFPKIPAPNGVNEGYSDCAKHVLAVKPRKGDALLFYSLNYKGEVVQESLHAACPVIKGVKWSMPTWIHTGHYYMGGDKYDVERAQAVADQERFRSMRELQGRRSLNRDAAEA